MANEIYSLGIARHSAPLKRLRRRYQQFRTRAMQHAQQHDENDLYTNDPTCPLKSIDLSHRIILGSKVSVNSPSSAPFNEFVARHPSAEIGGGQGSFGAAAVSVARKS